MKIIGVIPARWGSTRFEGKVLADLLGKPVLQHVWERAQQSSLLEEVYIACDDERIFSVAQKFKARVILTSRKCFSGTDRIAEAVKDIQADMIVNIQGDEPLIEAQVIDGVIRALIERPECVVATAVNRLHNPKEIESPHVVKAVIDTDHTVLYFSRAVIPFARDHAQKQEVHYYRHIGIYAYRRDFLFEYQRLKPSMLERAEKLEQLRILEHGHKMATIETAYHPRGVDTPQDLDELNAYLQSKQ